MVLEAEDPNMEVSASAEFLLHHPTGEGREEKDRLSNYTPSSLFIISINLFMGVETS